MRARARLVCFARLAALLAAAGAALACGAGEGDLAGVDPAAFADAAQGAAAPASVIAPLAADAAPARKPNVVLIVADDLGWGDLGSYGGALATPSIDRLAAEGVRFTDFYASAPVCSPSRAGLLTGRYPLRTGISYIVFAAEASFRQRLSLLAAKLGTRLGASDFHDSFVAGLPASEITIAEALRVAGYATGMVGKWHLGDFSHDRQYLPTRHGFDFFEGLPHSNDEFPVAYWRGEQEQTPDIGLAQEGITADLTRAAIEFVEANRDRPFFLYFAHKNVHLPLYPAERFRGASPAGAYGDSVAELDASVGEIVAALARLGLRDDTLVLFTSDNGPWFQGSAGGLRGRKGMPFEGGVRVPLLASWPGALPAGRVVGAPAMNIDVFPTLLARAGLAAPRDRAIDGRDLWPLLTGAASASPHEALFFFHDKQLDGVRAGAWKYYRHVNRLCWPLPYDKPGTLPGEQTAGYVHADAKTGRSANLLDAGPMLYDLARDPGEAYDVAERRPDEAARLEALAAAWEAAFVANPRGWR